NDDELDFDSSMTGAFDGAVFESIQEEILEAMTSLISDLASTDADDDFGLNHAFNLCADRIELLGMSIATAGLMGLMDVCMIFQSGLRNLANREKQLSDDEQIIIEEWTSHLIAYLSSPTDHDIVDQLVNYLNNIPWLEAMSEDEVMTLRLMLIPEDIEVTAPYDDSIDLDFSDNFSSSIAADKNNDSVQEDELIYEIDNDDGLEDISVSEDMYFLGQELIQLIHDEFQLEQPSLDEEIQNIEADKILNESDIEHLSQFNSMIERFSLATESIGLTGLNKTLAHIVKNLTVKISNNNTDALSKDIVQYLKCFSKLSLNYLNDMDDAELINQLVSPLYIEGWYEELGTEKALLEKELLSPRLLIEDDIEIRATEATLDDISLKLPDDVNQQLLNTLLQELPIQTEEFTQAITQIVEGNASLKDVEKAQRIAHTLKGAANTVGVVGIATLTHHIEDIFDVFTNNKRLPGKNLADILMNAADVLEMMSESLLGLGDEPENAQTVLQQILDWANLIDQEGIPEDDAQIELSQPSETSASASDTSHLNEVAAPTMLRVPASLMDELLRIAGESIILGGQLQERLRMATQQTQLVHEQNTLYQQLVFELEQIVDVQGLSANRHDSKENEVFDSLELEQYNELHTVTHRLVEAATDSKELTHAIEDELNNLDTLLVDQSRLHKENQNVVMQTRMVPVQNIVPRLQRSIRQTSRSTNKNVTLDVEGSETLMDSDVLNDLVDPIMHVLRNAIDHGIEPENIRAAKGKNANGNITLSFFRDGDHIVVRCVDDGAGLDFDSIRKTAIKKNFITSEQKLSDDELTRLIWLAGFTTRDTTTQVSGRGIGMDAVYNQIAAMKGTISINSEKNKGCTVELRLPVTLISVHAILVKLRKQTIAVSNRGIGQILSPGDGQLKQENNEYTYHLKDEVYNAFDIETLLHQPRDQRNNDREERSVLIVNDETGRQYAVTVEHIIANQDLIVKQLGAFIPDIIGIEGATILGDGSVAPVLDIPGLIRTAATSEISPLIEQRLAEAENIKDNLVALVVDDSLSARRSLAEFVKDIGYDVRMARDGIEALEVIETKIPDIILVDLEMPRMNGLELTSHIRSKSATKDIPVIMITSRSTEKHREMADAAGVNNYLTKPFAEDELLENIQNLLLLAAN
ncbi:MAG: response regulator, partial [Gammaproteobacteria bacterium]|nr:response regulator [Gammaproteobacteria bacterium]